MKDALKTTPISIHESDRVLLEPRDVDTLMKKGTEYTYFDVVQGTSNEVSVVFDEPFKNVVSVEIVQAQIPFTEYTIEHDRNHLSLEYQDGGGNWNSISVTLYNQDYSSTTLITAINEGLSANNSNIQIAKYDPTSTFYFSGDTPFRIKETTTCLTPLGLGEALSRPIESTTEIPSHISSLLPGSATHVILCPFKWDLIPSNVLYIHSPELDPYINRGRASSHKVIRSGTDSSVTRHTLQPLATFMYTVNIDVQEKHYSQSIPYRKFAPVAILDQLTLRFYRDTSNLSREVTPFDFKGLKWCLKLAIVTREMDSWSYQDQPPPPPLINTDIDVKNQLNLGNTERIAQSLPRHPPRRTVIPSQLLGRQSLPRAGNYFQ